MADQFSKTTILDKLKQKCVAKGFELNPKELPKGCPSLIDTLNLFAEAIAEVIQQEQSLSGTIKAKDLKIGPSGMQQPAAYKTAKIKFDATTDPKFFTWMETLHSLIQIPWPQPNGAPDTFATGLRALLAQKPTSLTGKIIDGSKKIKVTT